MNNLLFTALIIALLYYFFYYLPSQKKLNANPPLKHNRETQTDELEERIINEEPGAVQYPGPQKVVDPKEYQKLQKDIAQKEQTIIGLNNSYEKLELKKNQELEDLKKQINTLTHQLTQLQTNQNNDEKDLTKTLDELLKGIQDLNQEL
jgi:septal ring factor EnvC (AmiA/AmiB activator)